MEKGRRVDEPDFDTALDINLRLRFQYVDELVNLAKCRNPGAIEFSGFDVEREIVLAALRFLDLSVPDDAHKRTPNQLAATHDAHLARAFCVPLRRYIFPRRVPFETPIAKAVCAYPYSLT